MDTDTVTDTYKDRDKDSDMDRGTNSDSDTDPFIVNYANEFRSNLMRYQTPLQYTNFWGIKLLLTNFRRVSDPSE